MTQSPPGELAKVRAAGSSFKTKSELLTATVAAQGMAAQVHECERNMIHTDIKFVVQRSDNG